MLLIYTKSTTPRLKYTFDLVFKEIMGIDYAVTHHAFEFGLSSLPKFNYSEEKIADELFFYSSMLLFEKGIRRQEISVFDWEDTKVFFATHPKYIFPFDPFAASFYLVSRYEEYLPHHRDQHDRFDAKESLAFEKGFLNKPLVNIWVKKIKQVLLEKFPQLKFPQQEYRFVSTIDIDNAFAYREKGLMRTGGAIVRSLLKLDLKQISERVSVLTGRRQDPYDTYEVMNEIQKKYELNCIYFFLLGDYGENDKNVSAGRKKLQSLIKSIADYSDVGIHPSYGSNANPGRLRIELSRLRKVLKRDVTKSRQHFLVLHFPSTYRRLIDHDITDDYSMGYSGSVGFRASICTPFYFYDLELETSSKLRIHPFAVMDATLKYYMKIKPGEAISYIEPLVKEVKHVDGTFISLWHNESLSNIPPWEGWKEVYEQVVRIAYK
ncbi:MAG: polysaccharide deacetylase family protein [Bacteroidetes bacterium]|nr:polysaccharide deacetylase family protein [Bacteroidota bacterium]